MKRNDLINLIKNKMYHFGDSASMNIDESILFALMYRQDDYHELTDVCPSVYADYIGLCERNELKENQLLRNQCEQCWKDFLEEK